MMWAKEEKRFLKGSRLAMISLYAVCLSLLSLAAFAEESAFRVTQAEAEEEIAKALVAEGLAEDVQVNIIGRRSADLIQRDVPVAMEIESLRPDTANGRFTATLAFASEASLDRPSVRYGNLEVAGRFEAMQDVPVMKSRLSQGTVIREEDITLQKLPVSRIARETVTDMAEMVGKTPSRVLAAGRPVKAGDLQVPPVVKRQNTVHMHYQSAHISITAVGTAMQDGAVGDRIRVRNDASGNSVEAIVTASGQVKVLPAPHAMRVATTADIAAY